MKRLLGISMVLVAFLAAPLSAASLVLNEFNAVASDEFLDGAGSTDKVDTFFGRIMGNGGNWLELVVVQDHTDLRNWQLRWAETGADSTNGSDIWYGDSNVEQGILTFADDPFWADVRSGIIITISEKELLETEDEPGNPVQFDLSTDTGFDPFQNDWLIHISTNDEADEILPLISTVTNVDGDVAGDFSIGKDDWELTILRAGGLVDYGPIGEDVAGWGGGGLSDKEAGRLEADPSASVGPADYDDATSTTFGSANEYGGVYQDFSALRAWVPEPATLSLLLGGGLWLIKRRRHPANRGRF
ncbi:MAG: PEP-CTERM sorting domain-containing protein [Sedimentisphaerales bacterium]|nr:PEP-CTERM sorting domain-containing protein [Sedimentisphaerales bacterium]